MRVLIVDDDHDIRESLREFFQDEGIVVDTAAHGGEAYQKLTDGFDPSVVILDLRMPEVDGLQLYALMQRDPRLSKVPVIISTSDPTQAPPGVLIMRKPMDLSRLLGAVMSMGGPASLVGHT